MLRGEIIIGRIGSSEEYTKIREFCTENDIQIFEVAAHTQVVLAKPKKMYKLMKFLVPMKRQVISIALAD